jgi:hypothetical protein
MTAHGIVAPRPQRRFHFRTGMTRPGYLQLHVANLELLIFQRQQV